MLVFAWIEWNWGEAILDESWRDLVSLVGFAVTAIGFIVTIWQLRKTKSAASAAKHAAEEALQENQAAFRRFVLAVSFGYMREAKIFVQNKVWENASIRLGDLADQVAGVIAEDADWEEISEELREWAGICNRHAAGEIKRFNKQDWLDFCIRIEKKLARSLQPFEHRGKE